MDYSEAVVLQDICTL